MRTRGETRRSIAGKLIASVMLIQLISALGLLGATVAYERHTHFQAFDVMLRGRADSLLGAVQDADDKADDIMLDRTNLQLPAEDIYLVQDGAGHVLGRSANWQPALDSTRSRSSYGIFRVEIAGVPYRFIRVHGIRVVDPGEVHGGTTHTVIVLYGSETGGVWKEIHEAVAFYAAASCLLLLLTGSLVFWQLHRGLLPLRELAIEAQGVSAHHWSFSPPQSARSTKELAPLAAALEAAVKRLEQTFDQQRHFVSDAAHELKTAVAVIKSSLQLLTMRSRSAVEYEAGLDRTLADCARLEEIVAKMLMLARLESPPTRAGTDEAEDLTAAARDVAEQIRPFGELRQVRIRMDFSGPAYVSLNVEECRLLCSNLLMNALQHSGRSEEVTLCTRFAQDGSIELRVEDHGEGIDRAILSRVFERFYRGDPSRARKTGGTGLGLAICKAIAEKTGGSIHLDSTPGVGTTAIVRLPRARDPIGRAPMIPVGAGSSSA